MFDVVCVKKYGIMSMLSDEADFTRYIKIIKIFTEHCENSEKVGCVFQVSHDLNFNGNCYM